MIMTMKNKIQKKLTKMHMVEGTDVKKVRMYARALHATKRKM